MRKITIITPSHSASSYNYSDDGDAEDDDENDNSVHEKQKTVETNDSEYSQGIERDTKRLRNTIEEGTYGMESQTNLTAENPIFNVVEAVEKFKDCHLARKGNATLFSYHRPRRAAVP